jgi:3-methyl-2-oxobutanoate hydroxymethyltransferase
MLDKVSAPNVYAMKRRGDKIACVTAYDYVTAFLSDRSGVDLILVGDSVGNVVLGYESTLPVTMDEMVYHTKAVSRGVHRALLVTDMPLGSYEPSVEVAVQNAVTLVKAGAQAVKLEGDYPEQIKAIVKAGIPVMGHLGMTPQSVHNFGGFKVQGKGEKANVILNQAQSIDQAGVFAIVLELIPAQLANQVTNAISCPTIGIGAGVFCDGQIQVFHDILGLSSTPLKHAKRYAEVGDICITSLQHYVEEVRGSLFPKEEHSF